MSEGRRCSDCGQIHGELHGVGDSMNHQDLCFRCWPKYLNQQMGEHKAAVYILNEYGYKDTALFLENECEIRLTHKRKTEI